MSCAAQIPGLQRLANQLERFDGKEEQSLRTLLEEVLIPRVQQAQVVREAKAVRDAKRVELRQRRERRLAGTGIGLENILEGDEDDWESEFKVRCKRTLSST